METIQEKRRRYSSILDAYDKYLLLNNQTGEAETMSLFLPLWNFDEVASALFDYEWDEAIELLNTIVCSANDKADREKAISSIADIHATRSVIFNRLEETAEHCIELGYLDLYAKLMQ